MAVPWPRFDVTSYVSTEHFIPTNICLIHDRVRKSRLSGRVWQMSNVDCVAERSHALRPWSNNPRSSLMHIHGSTDRRRFISNGLATGCMSLLLQVPGCSHDRCVCDVCPARAQLDARICLALCSRGCPYHLRLETRVGQQWKCATGLTSL